MDPTHEFATVNGIRMRYVREGSGFPLVLLHGWPEFWRTWRKNIPALADSHTVIAPDLRGFGETEKPDRPAREGYRLEDHVEDLKSLLDTLGFDEAGLVGHDIGAYVMQSFAREHPERVRGLFFFDCPYPGIGDRWLRADHIDEIWYQSFNQQPWAADLVGANRETCRMYIGHFLRHWAGDPGAFSEEDIEAWVDTFLKPGNLQGGFNWYIAADERRKRLMREGAPSMERIEVPTRVRWGSLDPILDSTWGDRLDEYFSNYAFEPIEDAGHFAHYEKPDLANEEIAAFFAALD
ncbi:MAG: alpha/beta hydrolase [Euryarchaeota archaeon]|nr:alpha/beta hydrolase [Euryarchaeota archaeon]